MSFRRGYQAIMSMTARRTKQVYFRRLVASTGVCLAGKLFVHCEEKGTKLKAPDPSTLTTHHLIRNASIQTIDSATAMLTQTASSLLESHEEYKEKVQTLIKLMELNMEVLGNKFREERVHDAMLHMRMQINEIKERQQELEIILSCAEKVLMSAAEAAHMAGAEFAAMSATERLNSAKFQLEMVKNSSSNLDQDVVLLQAQTISATVQHHKKQRDKDTSENNTDISEEDSSKDDNKESRSGMPEQDSSTRTGDAGTTSDDRSGADVKSEFKTLGLPRSFSPGEDTSYILEGDRGEEDIIITGVPKGGFPGEEFEEVLEEHQEGVEGEAFPSEENSGQPDTAEELKA